MSLNIDPTIEAIFGPPPPGISLNDSTTLRYNVTSCIILGMAMASVALRFYVRTTGKGSNLGIDDYSILVALTCTCGLVATTVVAGIYGSGQHVWTMNIPRLVVLMKIVFIEPWVYAAAVTSTKISILLLYRRLFFTDGMLLSDDRLFAIMFWVAATFTCFYPIIMWITMACACRPLSFFWTQWAGDTNGSCIDVLLFYLVFGIINMINDVIILAVPIPRIARLHMNTRKKASVVCVMLLGGFVCVASIIRIYVLAQQRTNADIAWISAPGFGWSNFEPSVAIISACLPTLAPLFHSIRNKHTQRQRSTITNGYVAQSGSGPSDIGNPNLPWRQSHFQIDDDEIELTSKKHQLEGSE